MFSSLRLRLSALYLAVNLAFLALMGGVAYGLLNFYFQSTTDSALRRRMAYEFNMLNLSLPSELEAAVREYASYDRRTPGPLVRTANHSDEREHGQGNVGAGAVSGFSFDDPYDSELAAIFLIPLDADGDRIATPRNTTAAQLGLPDVQAAQAAMQNGSDLRTATAANGARVRLLTYRLPSAASTALLQLGRTFADQDRILQQLLTGLLVLGGVLTVLSALGSWWLAGRSLRPMQRAWERQKAFVANASHELRTPLSLIQLSAEIATRDDTTDAERQELASDVLRESHYMTKLVSDLLLLSRLDAGQLTLEMQPAPLAPLLADVQEQMSRLAQEHGISVIVKRAEGKALADVTRLRQVLLILMDNAMRHTPSGGTVSLESKAHGHAVEVVVADTGSGIATEHLSNVFDRFYQADSSHTEKGSAGLGLSIAKSLVEAMGGRILIESQLGKGTQVTVSLPE